VAQAWRLKVFVTWKRCGKSHWLKASVIARGMQVMHPIFYLYPGISLTTEENHGKFNWVNFLSNMSLHIQSRAAFIQHC
jgi:hypothetical protein